MIFSPYLQGVPNAKNSYLYSRLMFLQSNAEHIPHLQGKNKEKKKGGGGEKRGGGRHKGPSYFLCHLLASTFTAIPLHHVKDCKQANNNSASETTVRERHTLSCSRGLSAANWGGKNICFTVHLNNIYLFCTEKKVARGFIWTIVSGLAKYLWHMPFTGCGGAVTIIYDETSHHGISFSKWYTAIHQWIPTCAIFLSNRGHVTAEHAGGLLLITDTYFDGWIHVKQSNLL